ncbi:hypothetical protein D3C73_1294730 [compost metagenome]
MELNWSQPYGGVFLSDALEREVEPLSAAAGPIKLDFAPYEIKTLKINKESIAHGTI